MHKWKRLQHCCCVYYKFNAAFSCTGSTLVVWTSSTWFICSSVSPHQPSLAGSWLVERELARSAWCVCVLYLHICLQAPGIVHLVRPLARCCSSFCFSGNCESEETESQWSDRLNVWPACAHLIPSVCWPVQGVHLTVQRSSACGRIRIRSWTNWALCFPVQIYEAFLKQILTAGPENTVNYMFHKNMKSLQTSIYNTRVVKSPYFTK